MTGLLGRPGKTDGESQASPRPETGREEGGGGRSHLALGMVPCSRGPSRDVGQRMHAATYAAHGGYATTGKSLLEEMEGRRAATYRIIPNRRHLFLIAPGRT